MASFFDRLFKSPPSQETLAKTHKESRLHQRYRLEDFDRYTVAWEDGQALRLQDLSYGGFALDLSPNKRQADEHSLFAGTLHLPGESCPFTAKKVWEDAKLVGFQFVHDDDRTLKFLRPFLENLRAGESMEAIDPAYLSDQFSKRYQIAIRGDGPTDLFLENTAGGPVKFLMTLRNLQIYHEIRLRDQSIITGRSFDEQGVATRMVTDTSPDPLVLKKAIQILMGALVQNGPHVASIRLVFEKLCREYEASSAGFRQTP